jgi:hypothetical protein
MKMYRFLQTPPNDVSLSSNYPNQSCLWNADIHIVATYVFLSDEERKIFSSEDQVYLIKDVFEYSQLNVVGTKRINITSNGMIASWMILLQRNDVNLRNEWSNFTNWSFCTKPQNIMYPPNSQPSPMFQPSGEPTGFMITGPYSPYNQKTILQTMAILLDGKYRENDFESGIYSFIEQVSRSSGAGMDGIHCYNFCLNTDPFINQPSGAMNLSLFRSVEIEVTTLLPPLSADGVKTEVLCENGKNLSIINKPAWMLYEYGFNIYIMEERFNILSFANGQCGVKYCR